MSPDKEGEVPAANPASGYRNACELASGQVNPGAFGRRRASRGSADANAAKAWDFGQRTLLLDNPYDHSRAFRGLDRRDIPRLDFRLQRAERPADERERFCCKSSATASGGDGVGDLIVVDPKGADRAVILDDIEMRVLPRQTAFEPSEMTFPRHGLSVVRHGAGQWIISPFEQQLRIIHCS